MSGLFQLGDFQLHSGGKSSWKIDCDALTDSEIEALAEIGYAVLTPLRPFREVVGVPRGGLRLAAVMAKYKSSQVGSILVVDDVLTTGKSMREERDKINARGRGVFGLVIFARTAAEPWVHRIFQMSGC